MKEIEAELRDVLRRKKPNPEFASRILEQTRQRRHGWSWGRMWAPAFAAALALIVGVALWERQRQAERAHDELVQALQITAKKISFVQNVAIKNLREE
jgi:hypothetical protein